MSYPLSVLCEVTSTDTEDRTFGFAGPRGGFLGFTVPAGYSGPMEVAEAPWSVAEWAVAPRFDHPRATVLVLVLG